MTLLRQPLLRKRPQLHRLLRLRRLRRLGLLRVLHLGLHLLQMLQQLRWRRYRPRDALRTVLLCFTRGMLALPPRGVRQGRLCRHRCDDLNLAGREKHRRFRRQRRRLAGGQRRVLWRRAVPNGPFRLGLRLLPGALRLLAVPLGPLARRRVQRALQQRHGRLRRLSRPLFDLEPLLEGVPMSERLPRLRLAPPPPAWRRAAHRAARSASRAVSRVRSCCWSASGAGCGRAAA